MKKLILLLSLFLFFYGKSSATTQGDSFTYQGELIASGQVANGNYDINVNLYSTQVGGSSLSNALFSAIFVSNGIFSLQIDMGDTHFTGEERWISLEVREVGGGVFTPLLPRQLITNVPYAIESQYVGVDGVDTSAIKNGVITTIKIANDAITTSKILNGSVTNSKIAVDAINSTNIVNSSIVSSDIATGAVQSDEIADGSITALDIDNSSVQQRINGSCAAGSSINAISSTGTVTCEVDNIGTIDWSLTGNSATTPGTNFLGTTDNQSFEIHVNSRRGIKIEPIDDGAAINPPNILHTANITLGSSNNSVDGIGSTIGGGDNNIIDGIGFDVLAGGNNNYIGSTSGNMPGGNVAINGTISGGRGNIVSAPFATVPGGSGNIAGGNYSFAAGSGAHVRNSIEAGAQEGDQGTFVWSHSGMTSTGINQFLVQAEGGMGVGINAPLSPLHIKGQGTSNGSTSGSNEVVLTIESKTNTDNAVAVINRLDVTKQAGLMFSTSGAPQYDIRTHGDILQFNHYDGAEAKDTIMRFIYQASPVNSIMDVFANIEPSSDNAYNLGEPNYRWSTVYTTSIDTTNAVNVTSDKRLKSDIEDIDYGLAEIIAMRPVSYHMKNGKAGQLHLGLIAQEVETIVPEIVNQRNDPQHTRSMRYSELIPILIKATQEQQTLIEQQNETILEQSQELEYLKVLVERLIKSS